MEIKFKVKMTVESMYDYMLYHSFRESFQGVFGELCGLLMLAAFFGTGKWLYLLVGIVLVLYLPVALYLSARKQVLTNEVFKEDMCYTLDSNGLEIAVLEQTGRKEWKEVTKVVSTGKNLILYTNRITATLFPRKDLGEQYEKVVELIKTNVESSKVKIK